MNLASPCDRVLIVCLRRLGDVLLSTPLSVSIREAWPQTQIDWLVFKGTDGILQSNPAARKVMTIPPDASIFEIFRLLKLILRRYDLAISVQAGDRPSLLARLAGRRAITFGSSARGAAVRNWIFSAVVTLDRKHRVDQILSLLEPLKIPALPRLSAPDPDFSFIEKLRPSSYVVLHPGAAFRYKKWTNHGWRDLATRFINSGLTVVITGGAGAEEKHYLDRIFSAVKVTRLDGLLTWPQLTGLIMRAEYFVGVDTSVTHLAAVCNRPGLAIFGPTDPTLWRPYTQGGNNPMSVVQNRLPCVPCQKEGCERHSESYSLCLDTLDASTVWSRVAFKSRHTE